jgi:hypothetical protein
LLLKRTSSVNNQACFAGSVSASFIVGTNAINVNLKTSVGCQRLLAKETLGLSIELLDQLSREQASVKDLHPPANSEFVEAKF